MRDKIKTMLRKIAEQKEEVKIREADIIKREIIKATGGKKIVISITEEQLNKIMTDCYQEGANSQIDEDNKRFLEYVGEDEVLNNDPHDVFEDADKIAKNELRQELRDKLNKK